MVMQNIEQIGCDGLQIKKNLVLMDMLWREAIEKYYLCLSSCEFLAADGTRALVGA